MICVVMLWYIMMCYDMCCVVMLWYVLCCDVMICYIMLWCFMICVVMLWYVMIYYVIMCYDMCCVVMLWYVIMCYDMIWYVMWCDTDLLFTLFSSISPALTSVILIFVSHLLFFLSITSNKIMFFHLSILFQVLILQFLVTITHFFNKLSSRYLLIYLSIYLFIH